MGTMITEVALWLLKSLQQLGADQKWTDEQAYQIAIGGLMSALVALGFEAGWTMPRLQAALAVTPVALAYEKRAKENGNTVEINQGPGKA